ncbi:hypothetical protein IWQ57_001072 [Coemansia nantahalensis]|uniref:Uncharacterized protein n=1 Tax=Coemansia nantahalensis TaxID=2789366 RepID=A0ACC1K5D2_9FUNG|nr:hypothetical protein IWQ57_001072 [Coemansia nantahalensis]
MIAVMRTIIADEHTVRYSPSGAYVVRFLKEYIRRIEGVPDHCLDDELLEHYVARLASTDTGPGVWRGACYRTYTLDAEQQTRVVLQEEQSMISQGTTGLQMWEAGLCLADYVLVNPDIVRAKNVVELGAGCGLAGLVCAAAGAAQVVLTDFNGAVLQQLEHNRRISKDSRAGRGLAADCAIVDTQTLTIGLLLLLLRISVDQALAANVRVAELDWADTETCGHLARDADVIIGGDIARIASPRWRKMRRPPRLPI